MTTAPAHCASTSSPYASSHSACMRLLWSTVYRFGSSRPQSHSAIRHPSASRSFSAYRNPTSARSASSGSRMSSRWNQLGCSVRAARYRSSVWDAARKECFLARRNRNRKRASVRHRRMCGCLAIQSRSRAKFCLTVEPSSRSVSSVLPMVAGPSGCSWSSSYTSGTFSRHGIGSGLGVIVFAGRPRETPNARSLGPAIQVDYFV
uniref:Uncharacterized protein n=1 Tax=Anopheles merus TaxID=30066 RepID=A0A182UVL4_ANOME